MKKIFSVVLSLVLAAALLAGCAGGTGNAGDSGNAGNGAGGGQGAAESTLTGATSGILEKILADAEKSLGEADMLPATFIDPITSENAPGMLGLVPDDFVSLVEEATAAMGAINTFAFLVSVVKCKSANDAMTVDGMIQSGFDSGKWICVFPEQSLTMVSGPYVLLAVATVAQTDAIATAFKSEAGGVATGPNIFYTGEIGGGAAGGGEVGITPGPEPLDAGTSSEG